MDLEEFLAVVITVFMIAFTIVLILLGAVAAAYLVAVFGRLVQWSYQWIGPVS